MTTKYDWYSISYLHSPWSLTIVCISCPTSLLTHYYSSTSSTHTSSSSTSPPSTPYLLPTTITLTSSSHYLSTTTSSCISHTAGFCHYYTPFLTTIAFLSSYPLPTQSPCSSLYSTPSTAITPRSCSRNPIAYPHTCSPIIGLLSTLPVCTIPTFPTILSGGYSTFTVSHITHPP